MRTVVYERHLHDGDGYLYAELFEMGRCLARYGHSVRALSVYGLHISGYIFTYINAKYNNRSVFMGTPYATYYNPITLLQIRSLFTYVCL